MPAMIYQTSDRLIDAVQTAMLITIAGVLIYSLHLVRKEIQKSVASLSGLFRNQKELEERIERIWKRIDDIEMRQGLRGDVEELARVKRLMDALEAAGKPPR